MHRSFREVRISEPIPLEGGLNIAPKATINKLRQEHRDKRFISREDLKKKYPDLFQGYNYAGMNENI